MTHNEPTNTPAELGTAFSDIIPQQLHWLWPNRIPRGKLTILDGDPGLGKSLLTLDLAARITTGQPMPDTTPSIQGNVILISFEDDPADTLQPRLLAANADLTRIRLLTIIYTRDPKTGRDLPTLFTLPTHLPLLIKTINQHHAILVIIDPLMAALSHHTNSASDQGIRRILTPLSHIAESTNASILIVRHLNKSSSTNPLYRGSGSIGIIASARTALLALPHPTDNSLRILANPKNNLSSIADNLIYHVTSNPQNIPIIQWLGTDHTPLPSLLKPQPIHSSISSERQTLLHLLQSSPVPLTPKELTAQSGLDHQQVRQMVRRMVNAGDILSPTYGFYTAPVHFSLITSSPSDHIFPSHTTTTPATPTTVSHPDSNFEPSPSHANRINSPSQPLPASLNTLLEQLSQLFHCSFTNHYLHWLVTPQKMGCPICDTWANPNTSLDPTLLPLYQFLSQHPPELYENRTSWLHHVTLAGF